ncbi:MAG: hypothetical protein HY554_01605 [Elusimicrobia bacterium]|nr:hypothetical protein [Elusimicrobiota bacterium]
MPRTGRLLLLAACLLGGPLAAAFASFEDTPAGPRAMALGSAYAAQADDVSGVFSNPAALVGLPQWQLYTTYEKMYTGLSDGTSIGRNIIAIGAPFRFGTMALGMDSFSAGSLYSERAMLLGYGRPIGRSVWMGVTLRNLSVKYGSDDFASLNKLQGQSKTGMGLDLGFKYFTKKLTWALSILNGNEPDMGIKSASKVDRKIEIGMAAPSPVVDFLASLVKVGNDTRFNIGLERWTQKRRLALRGGVNFGSRDWRNLGMGLGYAAKAVTFDYGLSLPFSGLASKMGTHQLGLTFKWGRSGAKRAARPGEEEEETGDVVRARTKGPSEEERERARESLARARADILKGRYQAGLEAIQGADLELMSDEEMADLSRLMKKTAVVASIFPRLEGTDPKTRIVKTAVGAFMNGNGKTAINAAIYAGQKWPQDPGIQRLRELVFKEFASEAFEVKPLQEVKLTDQFAQEALELIYGGKYVAAIAKCNEVLELEPDNILALTRIGSAYWAMGLEEPARNAWQRALKLDPGNQQLLNFINRKAPSTPVRRTQKQKVTPEQEDEFRNGVAYYERLKRAGADQATLEKILKKMIDQFEGTGLDLSYIYKEYERFRPKE